jgi:hypothetical protein
MSPALQAALVSFLVVATALVQAVLASRKASSAHARLDEGEKDVKSDGKQA